MRSLFLIIPAALFLSGCQSVPEPPAAAKVAALKTEVLPTEMEAKACEVVKQAIREDIDNPFSGSYHRPRAFDPFHWSGHQTPDTATATFDKCDISYSDVTRDYTVALAINIPHIDEYGVLKPDTFYYADAKLDPATGEMRAGSLVHD